MEASGGNTGRPVRKNHYPIFAIINEPRTKKVKRLFIVHPGMQMPTMQRGKIIQELHKRELEKKYGNE